jgi:hypothetical protein
MDPFSTTARHPLLACADEIEAALKDVADVSPTFMPTEAKAEALLRLSRVVDQAEALRLRVIASAGDVAEVDASPNVASWLAPRTRTDHRPNHHRERLAVALDRRWTRVGAGLTEGRVNLAQAEVIVRALDALGDEVDRELLARAEAELVERAADFGPRGLRALGDRILEVVAPETYDDAERAALEAAERRASAATRLSFRERGDGSTDVSMRLPDAAASRLRTCLEAYTSPRRSTLLEVSRVEAAAVPAADPETGRRLPHDRRLGLAFCSLLESVDPAMLPLHGGSATTVMVTVPLAELHAGLGVGTLGDGTRVSAGEVRRLACTAGIIPAVLDGRSEVLDLGRRQRLFSSAQRKALAVSQRTCRAEGCTVPSTWCEAHHAAEPWSRGGRTDLADGKLLCSWHHHRAHDDRYLVSHLPNGAVRFHQRT